jgi:beta-phosphoglucomutase-like phosphatase (HAD superfamily)
MIRAAIFDLDGTLVDSNELHVQAWQETFRHFGKERTVDRAIHLQRR